LDAVRHRRAHGGIGNQRENDQQDRDCTGPDERPKI
jgi:hypothetical protein